jgi:hypothetical protein
VKRFFLLLVLVAGATRPFFADAATSALPVSTQQYLIAQEKASWDLAIERKISAYKALHAPDYITVSGTGVADRAASEASALDPNVTFDHYVFSQFKVEPFAPNAVLITYHVNASVHDHGKPAKLDLYASSLWVKRSGAWINVFYQGTPAGTN